MRVLHVIAAARRGGAEQLVWLVGRQLRRAGAEVTVLFFEDGPLRATFEGAGLVCHTLGGTGRFRPAALSRIRDVLRGCDPQVVHLHGLRALFHVGPLARAQHVPVVFGAHAVSEVKDAEYGAFSGGYRRLEGLLCRAVASAVVATSDRMRTDLVARSGVPSALIRVIPPAVDLDRLPPVSRASRAAARERFGVDGFVVGMIGRLIPAKGHAVMVQAMANLAAGTLLLAGDGPERGRLATLAAALDVEARVLMLGDTSEIAAVCHASDAVVYPSTHGVLGLAALEAMACGVPVVASNRPGVTEFNTPEQTGILVPSGDWAALARALDGLLANPSRAGALARAGQASARARYSPAAAAALHLSLYEEITHGSTPRARPAPAPGASHT